MVREGNDTRNDMDTMDRENHSHPRRGHLPATPQEEGSKVDEGAFRRVRRLDVWNAMTALLGPEVSEQWLDGFIERWKDSLSRNTVDVDVDALTSWLAAGVSLFSKGGTLTMHDARRAADGVVLGLMVNRCAGNITRMAESLKASRRAVRERLKAEGLYEYARALRADEPTPDSRVAEGDDASAATVGASGDSVEGPSIVDRVDGDLAPDLPR